MNKKINIPKKGASRKWAQKFKELGQQPPPKDLMEIFNRVEKPKKVAVPRTKTEDMDI